MYAKAPHHRRFMSWKGEETREGLSNLLDAPEFDSVGWFALLKSRTILSSGIFPDNDALKIPRAENSMTKTLTTLCLSGLLTEFLFMFLSQALRWR